jgi:FkbH-like protein
MSDQLYLVADFNADTLARYLAHTALPGAEVMVAPFDQVAQSLAGPGPGAGWSAVVWTQPVSVSETFRRARAFEPVDAAGAIEDVTAFAESIRRFAARVRHVFVPTWVVPFWERGYGMVDWRPRIGLAHLLAKMNVRLADALGGESNVFVLDGSRWHAAAGPQAVSLKPWYAAKTPFGPALIEQAAEDISAALSALAGRARRLIILDLDDLLWGGIVGEVGWEGVTLGGHDFAGEAFADFQHALKALTRRGIQLAIASKNDEAAALDVLDRHPEMVLRREDFAAWRINWSDKAQSVAELLRVLNLGPESAVFIDDLPSERARVRSAVPGVLVPDWPADPSRYREALAGLRCFDTGHLTSEDRGRGVMYAAERSRTDALSAAVDLDAWLQSLGIVVSVEPLTSVNLPRAVQLLNKTNQLNMATRRLTQPELEQWASRPENLLLTFRVADRFGDSGLTGLVGLSFESGGATLTDFLLSCRVMGRNVEEAMLHAAIAQCRARQVPRLAATFSPTPRNAPCLEFLVRSGLQQKAGHRFHWDVSQPYGVPRWVTIDDRTGSIQSIGR